jgi:hypothetical protein
MLRVGIAHIGGNGRWSGERELLHAQTEPLTAGAKFVCSRLPEQCSNLDAHSFVA